MDSPKHEHSDLDVILEHPQGLSLSTTSPIIRSTSNIGDSKDESMIHNKVAEQIQNSIFNCFFLFLNYMIGSGILNQPYVFMQCGILGAFILYILASYFTWLGLMLITESAHFANIYEYQKLSNKAYGKLGDLLVDISVLIYAFGAELSYFIIVGSTMSDLLISWGCNNNFCQPMSLISFLTFIVMLPLCLFRHFGHFHFLSVFSIVCIALCVMLVLIGGPIVADTYTDDAVNEPAVVINSLGMLTSVGSLVFSLSCAPATLQIYISAKKEAQVHRTWMLNITLCAVLVGTFMLIVMGLSGYLSFRGATKGNILDNFHGNGFDIFKLLVVIHLLMYLPLDFVILRYRLLFTLILTGFIIRGICLRNEYGSYVMNMLLTIFYYITISSIVKLVTHHRVEDMSWIVHFAISFTLLIVILIVVLGIMSNNQNDEGKAFAVVLNITGGVAGSLLQFIIPSMIYLKLVSVTSAKLHFYYPAFACFSFGIAVFFCVIIGSAYDAAN